MDMINSELIYQLIAGAAILTVGILLIKIIGKLFVVTIIGISIYYFFMATNAEKETLQSCLLASPSGIYHLTIPNECNSMIETIKNKVPNELEKKAREEATKTEQKIKETENNKD